MPGVKPLAEPDLGFRGDVEGLRAICVLAVLAYHVSPAALPGGFLGVDMFFVISGYVITRLLIADHTTHGHIRFAAFWERRIRRILPVSVLVLVLTAAAILAFPVLDGRAIGRDLLAAALFYHNIRQMNRAVDYLEAPPDSNPTLHYWSLSVEEQFYLVWPLLLASLFWLAARIMGARWRTGVSLAVALLTAIFFAVCIWLASQDPAVAFFHPAARAWQLMAGASVACREPSLRSMARVPANLIAMAAAAVLFWMLTLAPFGYNYPGVWSAAPTLGTAALIAACSASPPTIVGSSLAVPLLRFIGKISFSLYLWHWPVLVFARVGWGDSLTVGCIAAGLAFILAVLSFYAVEQPIRHWRGRQTLGSGAAQHTTSGLRPAWDRALAPGYVLGAVLFGTGAAVGAAMRVAAPDLLFVGNGVLIEKEVARRDRPAIYDGCLTNFEDVKSAPCAFGALKAARTVVLLGDSHAANWFEPLRDAASAEGWRILVRAKASCRPLLVAQTRTSRSLPYPECEAFLAATLQDLRSDPTVKLIVVGGTRHRYHRRVEADTFTQLAAIAPVVVMRDTPWLPMSALDCLRQKPVDGCVWPLESLLRGRTFPLTDVKRLPSGVSVLDLNTRVCPHGECRAAVDGWPMMFDEHHFTATFSRRFTSDFVALLRAAAQGHKKDGNK